jgi:hypothetical protein
VRSAEHLPVVPWVHCCSFLKLTNLKG